MATYYSALDKTVLRDRIEAAGNASHQIRNFLCGKNNAATPELLIVDQLSAQVEASTRDMLSLVEHSICIRQQLTNSIRCTKLSARTLSQDLPSYVRSKIADEQVVLVTRYVQSTEALLSEIATMIVSAMTKQVIADFQVNLKIVDEGRDGVEEETRGCDEKKEGDDGAMGMELAMDFKNAALDVDRFTLSSPCSDTDTFLSTMDAMARNGCNSAHQMQNLAAPFVRRQPGCEVAKQIVGIAGQMENQWRNIEAQIYNFKAAYASHPNVDALKRNLCNGTKKQTDAVLMNLEKVNKLRSSVIPFDAIEAVEGSMQVLVAVFRNNFKLQFGL